MKGNLAKRLFVAALDAVFPGQCLSCNQDISSQHCLCVACFSAIRFIRPPACECCGLPLLFALDDTQSHNESHSDGQQNLCASCQDRSAVQQLGQVQACFIYNRISKAMLLKFKYMDRLDLAPRLAQWLIGSNPAFFTKPALLVPVPLHWSRLIKRRYNQAQVLCEALAQQSNCAYNASILKRVKHSASHGQGLSAEQRFEAMEQEFTLIKGAQDQISGRRIILIDDVKTTGATLEHCARVLKQGGALSVDAAVIALVLPRKPAYLSLQTQEAQSDALFVEN